MNDNEFDLAARAWLEAGPNRMSDRAVLSSLETIHTTRQRRAVWPAWRATPVSSFARMAVAAVLVVAVGLLAGNLVPREPDRSSVGGPPTPSSTADPTPSPSSSPSPSPSQAQLIDLLDLNTTFVSPRNGFSMKYWDRGEGTLTPAKAPWDPASAAPYEDAFDTVETGLGAVFQGASTEIPEGVSIDDWTDVTLQDMVSARSHPCSVLRFRGQRTEEVTIDGRPGRLSRVSADDPICTGLIVATVPVDGRLYVFMLGHGQDDASARAFFDAFAATIDLRPEDAVVPSSTPSS